MTARFPIPRPTEVAARSARPLPPVPALMAAHLAAHRRRDREGAQLTAHRVVRATTHQVGEA